MSSAVQKLTVCMEKLFKESPEARKAMREWLDELEREQRSSPKSVVHAPSITIACPATQPPKGLYFGDIPARYHADPADYNWKLERVVLGSKHAIYSREFTFGEVKLRYYFTTGTIQLVYPMHKHREYESEETLRIHQLRHVARLCGRDVDSVKIRRITENFRDLTGAEFKKLLSNAPDFFGEGYLANEIKMVY